MCDSIVQSKAELARRLGVVEQTVRRWTKHPEWRFDRHPPYDVGAIRKWRAATITVDSAAGHRAEAQAEQAGGRMRRLAELLCELRDADPAFWLRAVIGVVGELQQTFVGAPGPDDCSAAERAEFYATVQAAADARAKLKTLSLPTCEAAERFLKLV